MINKLRKVLKSKKGFTLIELIVVIAILGILATVAVPRLNGFQATARHRANDANLQTIQNAVRVFEANTGALPTALANLQDAQYLGQAAPVPQVVAAAGANAAVVAGQVFQMNTTTGVVTISTSTTGADASNIALSGPAQ
ncbi:competence type IV pilus major pilin ComGC [Anaerosolibacter sp.]|uniref:competence type IV pilus major pilin ComGC n=1 Tax=Anaerosolibacter sp. TaxID=1872527 RepID=UPI0039F014C6